jgi:hypothetical protein
MVSIPLKRRHRSGAARRTSLAAVLSALVFLILAGSALADGARRIELEPVGEQPEAGGASVFVIRLLEGDHAVEGADVRLIAGRGGTHEGHDMGGTSPLSGAPFEVSARPGDNPGEYLVEAEFSTEGVWKVWVTAEQKGVLTEAAYEIAVAPAPASLTPAPAAGAGSTGDHSSGGAGHGTRSPRSHAEETNTPATSGAEEVPAAAITQVAGEAADGGHGGGHPADGEVNWLVLLGFAIVMAGATVGAAILKRHLARQIALGNLRPEGAKVE